MDKLKWALTTDELNEYEEIMVAIDPIVKEAREDVMMGLKPLAEWDAYVNQIKSLNIDRAVALAQVAIDRFLASN